MGAVLAFVRATANITTTKDGDDIDIVPKRDTGTRDTELMGRVGKALVTGSLRWKRRATAGVCDLLAVGGDCFPASFNLAADRLAA